MTSPSQPLPHPDKADGDAQFFGRILQIRKKVKRIRCVGYAALFSNTNIDGEFRSDDILVTLAGLHDTDDFIRFKA